MTAPISISFIIPYYKVELSLLSRAINSILQLGEGWDWEILVVDDGSPTPNEAETYIKGLKDERIYYHYQENSGPGGARNTGIELSQKEYIHFLDADDFLFKTTTLQALDLLKKERPDILTFDFRKIHTSGLSDLPSAPITEFFNGTGVEFMLKHNLRSSVWGYFFKKSVLRTLRFTPIAYHEDEEFTALLFLQASHIIITRIPVYAYYQRPDSIMHRTDLYSLEKRFEDIIYIINRLKRIRKGMDKISGAALQRHIDLLGMSVIYTLLCDSPNRHFLLTTLKRMQEENIYPLTDRRITRPYTLIRWATLRPTQTVFLYRLFRFLRIHHIGRAS